MASAPRRFARKIGRVCPELPAPSPLTAVRAIVPDLLQWSSSHQVHLSFQCLTRLYHSLTRLGYALAESANALELFHQKGFVHVSGIHNPK